MLTQPLVQTFPLAPVEAFLLVFTRLLAALATTPVLSTRGVPAQARIGLAFFAALVLLPVVGTDQATVGVTWNAIATEALVGALAGFAAALVYAAIQVGASLLDVQANFGLGSTYDPALGTTGTVLERFYGALAALLFLQVNGHHLVLGALRELFVVVPLGGVSPSLVQPAHLAEITMGMFRVALQLVLPVVAALLLADVALALLARAAPQFNLFAVGIPFKIAIALGAMVVALPLLLPRLEALFSTMAGVMVAVNR